MIFHSKGKRIIYQISYLVCALISKKRSITQRKVLDMNRCRNDPTGDIKTLTNMSFHLCSKNSCCLNLSNKVPNFSMIVCNQNLVTESSNLLSKPTCIMLAISTCAYYL